MSVRLTLAAVIAPAVVVLATGAPAAAFHHVALPADTCGQSDFAGGSNPIAVTTLGEHNPVQTLPLPPFGFENAPVDRGNCPSTR